MEYYERNLLSKLKKWIDRPEIYAIKGPRQSGKTTLLRILEQWLIKRKKVNQENIVFINFEEKENLEKFNANPKEFIKSFILNKKRYYFLLDEFHYVEDGGKKLKLLYDSLKNVKFVITGSSSLELAGTTAKYLVGRMFSFYLFPFSFDEFLLARSTRLSRIYRKKNEKVRKFILEGEEFDFKEDIFLDEFNLPFNEFIVYGAYPEVIKSDDPETKRTIIKNIYETYIGREVVDLLRVHDVFKFRKLVSGLSSRLGAMINYNELSSLCDSYYKEIIRLLDILEGTYVIRVIRPFRRKLATELRKNPKAYFVDLGLRNYAINNFNPLEERVDRGELVENFVLNQIFDLVKDMGRINYWRTLGKAEVDFVLNLGEEIIPIEVKYRKFKKPNVSRSLRSFISTYKPERSVVATKNFWGDMKINKTTIKFIPVYYL